MNCYTEIAKNTTEFLALANVIRKNRLPAGVTGLSHIHKAHVIASMCMCLMRKAVVITPDEAQATRLRQDMESFGIKALLYPARDFSFRTLETVSREYEHARLKVLDKMLSGDYDAVVLSAEAATQLTVPPAMLMNNSFSVESGEDYDSEEEYDGNDQYDGNGPYDGNDQYDSEDEIEGEDDADEPVAHKQRVVNIADIKVCDPAMPISKGGVSLMGAYVGEDHGNGCRHDGCYEDDAMKLIRAEGGNTSTITFEMILTTMERVSHDFEDNMAVLLSAVASEDRTVENGIRVNNILNDCMTAVINNYTEVF